MSIKKDKTLHFLVSLALSLIFVFFYRMMFTQDGTLTDFYATILATSSSFSTTVLIGWAKELRDGMGYGTKDINDLTADFLGAIAGIVMAWVVLYVF